MRVSIYKQRLVGAIAAVTCLCTFCAWGSLPGDGTLPGLAFRMTGGVSMATITTGSLTLEGAAGLGSLSISGLTELPLLPLLDWTIGGEIRFSREWLSIGAQATYDSPARRLSVAIVARATPAPLLLTEGSWAVMAGVSAEASVGALAPESFEDYRVVVSPYASLLPLDAGKVLVTGSAGLDLVASGADRLPSVATSRLEVSLSTDKVRITSSTQFAGLLRAFASQALSVELPNIGITVSGTILFPTPESNVELLFGAGYAFGDPQLLPRKRAGGSESLVCSGDTCLLP